MPAYVVDTTKQIIKALSGNKVTVFGLTYKGDVDDENHQHLIFMSY